MSLTGSVRSRTRANPRVATAALSVAGYALLAAGFAGLLPFPSLDRAAVELFAAAIAAVNSTALAALLLGWRAIRRRRIRRHRALMLSAFALIILFLVLYLWKVSGGYTKEFYVPANGPLAAQAGLIEGAYLVMLAVHIALSALAVPLVVHSAVLGLTHTPAELGDTLHPRVGRLAVATWSVSLALGVLTYLMLVVWESRPLGEGAAALLLVAVPASWHWRE